MAHIVLQMSASGIYEAEVCAGCDRRFERGELMSAIEAEDEEPLGWYCSSCIQEWAIRDGRYYEVQGFQRFGILVPRTVPVEAVVRMLAGLVSYVKGVKSIDHQLWQCRQIAEVTVKSQHAEDEQR